MQADRYLLVQHTSRRREILGQWGLPGGRIKDAEKPKACLRRELVEELGCRVPYLVKLGTGGQRRAAARVRLRDRENHRHLRRRRAPRNRAVQLRGSGRARRARKLRMGFELAAVVEFRLQARRQRPLTPLPNSHYVMCYAPPSLTAIVRRRRPPPLMESHVIKYLPSAERAVQCSAFVRRSRRSHRSVEPRSRGSPRRVLVRGGFLS